MRYDNSHSVKVFGGNINDKHVQGMHMHIPL